jgi:hypothetical protein
LVAVLILVTVAAGCSGVPGTGGHVSGSGNPTTKQYDYSGFTGLRVDNAFAATVTRGDAFGVNLADGFGDCLRADAGIFDAERWGGVS